MQRNSSYKKWYTYEQKTLAELNTWKKPDTTDSTRNIWDSRTLSQFLVNIKVVMN